MTSDECSVVRTDLDGHESALRELLREYFTEAEARALEWFEDDFSGADIEEIVSSDLDRLASPAIEEPLFLALAGDASAEAGDTSAEAGDAPTEADIVGNVQLKRLDETAAEVKRLYVVPEYRGEGLGRRLMEAVLDGAADDGFETLRLGVGPYLETARSLYEDLGFEYTPPYGQTGAPEEIHDQWRFMECTLDDGAKAE